MVLGCIWANISHSSAKPVFLLEKTHSFGTSLEQGTLFQRSLETSSENTGFTDAVDLIKFITTVDANTALNMEKVYMYLNFA